MKEEKSYQSSPLLLSVEMILLLLITKGEVILLAGVYTISFLAVMALFGLGNIL